MRIVGGRWADRSLVSPSGRVRPTAEALREEMMQLVGDELKGARVVDLFAGTGAIGLEALSRGAKYCDFVENGPSAIHSLKANVAALRVREKTRIYDRDAIPFVERLRVDRYDIAFVDPPYGSRKLDRVVQYWKTVPFSRILVMEHAFDHEALPRGTTRRFGESSITLLRAKRRDIERGTA
jgi:16S rRNA (guanine966-N2)-methyltransferase